MTTQPPPTHTPKPLGPQINFARPRGGAAVLVERRQRDGLGLLPKAQTPEQRRKRKRANTLGAASLIVSGLAIIGGSVSLLHRPDPAPWLGLLYGVIILGNGWSLARRRERRKGAQ